MVFAQLQVKTTYSLLQSPTTIKDLVDTAKALGYTTLAITDHNVVYGLVDFYKYCHTVGIKPILGISATFKSLLDPESEATYPYLLYAKNNQGYAHLLEISTAIMLHPEQPIALETVADSLKDLIMVLPPRGELEYLAGTQDTAAQVTYIHRLLSWLDPQNLAIGLTVQGNYSHQLSKLQAVADQTQIALCALGKVDYVRPEQAFDATVLQHIAAGTKLTPTATTDSQTGPFFLPAPDIAAAAFENAGLSQALVMTDWIAENCNVTLNLHHRTQLPQYQVPAGLDADTYLQQLVTAGLKKRLGKTIPTAYQQRADYELQVIQKMGFSDYFLIVWDVINYAHQVHIMTGAGRGSAAGSLVAYALAITEVDPLAYNLLFERFLNPNRANMPDIDLDIPDNRRDELLAYVYQHYGANHVAQIITFGTLAAKMALRDVGRVFGISMPEANAWSKAVPNVLKITLQQALAQSPALQKIVHENKTNELIFRTAAQLEGLPRHYSTHAAGVVLSDEPLTKRVALQMGGDEIPLTQYPMGNVEEVGLLKMDFLGLKNLNILAQTVADVQREYQADFDQKQIPLDDPKTLALFQQGDTNGVFQFESEGIKRVLRRLHPDSFEDIVATNALYRPGPMENIDTFIARKNGLEPVIYPDVALEPILKPTYGILVYQEQVMQAASVMGGFTLGEADLLRRAMSKKKKAVIDENKQRFIEGAVEKGIAIDSARLVYEYIESFANYGFNRSHAVAYSKLAFWLAYLKCHFPASFFVALLNSTIGNNIKTKTYLQEAKKRHIAILGPDINHSVQEYTLQANQIRFGFISIKGMRRDFIEAILTARQVGEFKDFNDFLRRLPKKFVKPDYLTPLIKVGVFDSLIPNRHQLLVNLDKLINTVTLAGDSMSLFEILTPEMVYVDDYSKSQKIELEAELLGIYISGHPLERFEKIPHVTILELQPDKSGAVLYYVRKVKVIRTKKGDQMAFLNGEDLSQSFGVTIFPNVFKRVADWLDREQNLVIKGKFEWDKAHAPQLIAQSIAQAAPILQQQAQLKRLFLQFPPELDTASFRERVYQLLMAHRGHTPVVIFLKREDKKILLKDDHWVTWSPELAQDLQQILGPENIVFR
ncbi:dnaE protein [Agrilactobacillus composti DSM 18527 = JCM 14202]|uniref:DNA-directed DNA polymerase n=1 Tax=Agrilactobacillus composti DSM 18527 = JCM 14202 TaxID=1423734 RepID=X0QKH8_9LACO|nr:DNA polymerase III subunit alpha [Agrilactobacillus composti]KRM36571.1 dnaE protein [Agrilactobacillus composti DSM 18527 = JCM 14202]GAF39110.1 DNA polymerase III alpha subunit [Agrilactobacillus composti DSM 18527 = JCM 14202]